MSRCLASAFIKFINHLSQDQISLKIILPEKLSCITLDRRGDLCAGGTSTGRIYIWEVFAACFHLPMKINTSSFKTSSGILFNSWDAHYRQVNVLQFTNDGAALVSGSDDSGVSVWSVSRSIWPLMFILYHQLIMLWGKKIT